MIWFKDDLTEEELKKEYRKLCKKFHPDVSKDPDAESKMKEINEQFDQYWVNQKTRAFEWVDTWAAKRAAQKYRATILVWLRRDQFNEGKYYSIIDEQHTYFWFWRETVRIKGITDNGPEWDGFKGGLAYCEYDSHYTGTEVELKKLPAKITPASIQELYYYGRDHWGISKYDDYYEVTCRFGTFWARKSQLGKTSGWTFYVKAELPEKFLKIGNPGADESKYSARSINLVFVDKKWIQEETHRDPISGSDIPYIAYQDCTEDEFYETHDVDNMGTYISGVGSKWIRNDFWFIDNPVVAMAARQGIIKIFESSRNFKIRCGVFDPYVLKEKMHLLSIDDAEEIQDYLDEINGEFIQHFKTLVKRGKISMRI